MSEYTDKNDLIRFLGQLKQPRKPFNDSFTFISIDDAIKIVSERPNANVVEQKKIDNAFEEMQRYSDGFHYMGKRDLENVVENCIKILRWNIGESE